MSNLTAIKLIVLESDEKKNKVILKYVNKRIDSIIKVGKLYFSEITSVSSPTKCHCSPNCNSQKFPHFVVSGGPNIYGEVRQMVAYLDSKIEPQNQKKDAPTIQDPEKDVQDYMRDQIYDGVSKQGKDLVVKQDQDDEGTGEAMSGDALMRKMSEFRQRKGEPQGKPNLILQYNKKNEDRAVDTKIPELTRGAERDDDDIERLQEIKGGMSRNTARNNNTGYTDDSVMHAIESTIKNSSGGDTDDNMVRGMFEKLMGRDDY